ncbi:hypothetical protein N0V90_010683 [Kalmusia sp. IMI 367209]|nr:hypothetical protein N0V90_010683 [Kalmusia sp. IMI 367209]
MGIPYSREINAAFEQVTPLVAAGFKVLQTMKDISILLAVIQVLTVFFLALILFVMVLLVYSVNPDLEDERQRLVTPFLQKAASLSVWGVLKGTISVIGGISLVLGATWYFYRLDHEEKHDLEQTADEDADKALESIEGGKGKKKKKQKNKDKGDKGKDKEKEEEGDDAEQN